MWPDFLPCVSPSIARLVVFFVNCIVYECTSGILCYMYLVRCLRVCLCWTPKPRPAVTSRVTSRLCCFVYSWAVYHDRCSSKKVSARRYGEEGSYRVCDHCHDRALAESVEEEKEALSRPLLPLDASPRSCACNLLAGFFYSFHIFSLPHRCHAGYFSVLFLLFLFCVFSLCIFFQPCSHDTVHTRTIPAVDCTVTDASSGNTGGVWWFLFSSLIVVMLCYVIVCLRWFGFSFCGGSV